LSERIATEGGTLGRNTVDGRQRLFIISDGMDVLFNDLTEIVGRSPSARNAAAMEVIRRYEEVLSGAGLLDSSAAVFSTERLCGWGGEHLCSEEEEARYPEASSDSKYLNAGGYIGPARVLERIVREVLEAAEQAKKANADGDLRARTTAVDAAGGETDQYFFKQFFWRHPEVVALDHRQLIFGNFLEVERATCNDSWRPRCAFQPCCTVSDDFRRFHEVFYERYAVRGCGVWRHGNLPITWHGNGAGKWLWLLTLEELSRVCAFVANLTVQKFPVEVLEGLFDGFQRR